jgi:putative chitinase
MNLHIKYKTLLDKYQINTKLRLAHFFAQLDHESGGFKTKKENLNYSVEGLIKTFGRHRISLEDCKRLGRTKTRPANHSEIANLIYGGNYGKINLGNIKIGDGFKYIGRGYKQITGRANYTEFAKWVNNLEIIDKPELLETEPYDLLSAIWFWDKNKLNVLADKDDVKAITKKINGGFNGLQNRINLVTKYKEILT